MFPQNFDQITVPLVTAVIANGLAQQTAADANENTLVGAADHRFSKFLIR